MKRNILLITLSLLILSIGLVGCTGKTPDKEISKTDDAVLKIGATPVPHVEILNVIKPKLEEKGIRLEIIEFTDYVKPNLSLNEKEIDANFFQHAPYMESFAKEHNIELFNAAKIHVEPLGLYSKKIKSIDELKDGSIISIPNDPTNGGRALLLLKSKGYIKLKEDAGLEATDKDIIENPKNLVFKPIDAAQLPRTLDDVDAAIINTNYALEASLNPSNDALLIEGSDSPYANILTIRPEDKDNANIKALIDALQSDEVKEFIEKQYKGAIVPVF
ncbi:MetQ/NlpA family ABC transporter substrate-binding protein [Paramaledivibacter caminithermalis]|jgi:D-methionine transport system substrate-binding protein|uniref:Lipoprotein n=1 Tax=Paramaledivibacter caminithermalis (strain DSM 15212 / CIP 107654 / DViRD3) TaxID=1121301 RepID=A0A1M6LS56_PARC5|nr:MetQ/NlpA family ABC transporter substrate-binding protein [Paramaledivibacter caminithermalis]SHJ74064.1 D-methionine transport system substrate-binding protein [Paramaledivibacter caminithermalis DSM 15212]